MELTIHTFMGKWAVVNKQPPHSKIIFIECDTSEEAMEIVQQLNGQTFEVIDAFHKTCKRIG
jgi:hypothetical protein